MDKKYFLFNPQADQEKERKEDLMIFIAVSVYIAAVLLTLVGAPVASEGLETVHSTIHVANAQITTKFSATANKIKPTLYAKTIRAYVTGYNSLSDQTDGTPCYAGSMFICGKSGITSCPKQYKRGTRIQIEEKRYTCIDRTAPKYDKRFDIFCDKDLTCPAKVTGWKEVTILN